MLGGYLRFDFGSSFFRGQSVLQLILQRLPVSISLGLWSTLLVYMISIPLGIAKAVRDGSRFDLATSGVMLVGYAIPAFCSPSCWSCCSPAAASSSGSRCAASPAMAPNIWGLARASHRLSVAHRAADRRLVAGGFASLTMLTKNCFLEEIRKQYVVTARAKGASERRVLYGHVFRNAMLLVVAGFPAAFIGILFTSQLLVEIIFSLDGLGLLGFQAAMQRDYPVMFGTLYIFTLLGLLMQIVGDTALYRGRSTHRFRGARAGGCRLTTRRRLRDLPAASARLSGRSGSSSSCSSSPCLPSSSRMTGRC